MAVSGSNLSESIAILGLFICCQKKQVKNLFSGTILRSSWETTLINPFNEAVKKAPDTLLNVAETSDTASSW